MLATMERPIGSGGETATASPLLEIRANELVHDLYLGTHHGH